MSVQEVQEWFRTLPMKKRREVARIVAETAEELKTIVQSAAPQGETGKTRQSVRVTRGRKELAFFVQAGGELTTKTIGTRTYDSAVNVGQGEDTTGRTRTPGGSNVGYDYALAGEFGTSRQAAQPWFYKSWRENQEDLEGRMRDRIEEAITSG